MGTAITRAYEEMRGWHVDEAELFIAPTGIAWV
jgi:hypothetical protein